MIKIEATQDTSILNREGKEAGPDGGGGGGSAGDKEADASSRCVGLHRLDDPRYAGAGPRRWAAAGAPLRTLPGQEQGVRNDLASLGATRLGSRYVQLLEIIHRCVQVLPTYLDRKTTARQLELDCSTRLLSKKSQKCTSSFRIARETIKVIACQTCETTKA
ncbi:hypothetical protein KM043_014928 [Ampulex compressa]|nr:hypothetical protein KM043_014928 [Ampulex compressa]